MHGINRNKTSFPIILHSSFFRTNSVRSALLCFIIQSQRFIAIIYSYALANFADRMKSESDDEDDDDGNDKKENTCKVQNLYNS